MRLFTRFASRTVAFSALCLACTALTSVAARAQTQDTPAPAAEDATGEIVVTATRRNTLVSETPISIRAVSGDELEARGATSLQDYALSVPGLSYVEAGIGASQLTIRGIGSDAGAATVGYYLDESPLSSAGFTPDFANFDVERIEILRGPQGTLYGDSSMGGTLRVITKKPNSNDFEGQVAASIGTTRFGALSYTGSAVVNAPLIADKLAVRVTGSYGRDGGIIDNVGTGQKDVNGRSRYAVRSQLAFTPSEDLTINLSYLYQKRKNGGDNTIDGPVSGLQQNRAFNEPADDRIHLASATLNYDFGSANLVSATNYYDSKNRRFYDASQFVGGGSFTIRDTIPEKRFSQEVRLSSQGNSKVTWLIGGFYQKITNNVIIQQFDSPLDFAGLGITDYGTTFNTRTQKQAAVFGELGYTLFNALTVTGGLRYYDYKLEGTVDGIGPIVPFLGFPSNLTTLPVAKDDGLLKRVNVSYKINNDTLIYAQYADGFRIGGSNLGVSTDKIFFGPDSVKSYEAGIKGNWADGRVKINLTGYLIDWTNIQINNLDPVTGSNYTTNNGKARSKGLEFELVTKPSKHIQLEASFGWSDARLTQDNITGGIDLVTGAPVDILTAPAGSFATLYRGLRGERVPYTPSVQLAFAATYKFDVGAFAGNLRADYQYVGEGFNRIANNVQLPGAAPSTDPAIGGQGSRKVFDYSLVNLSLGLSRGVFDINLYVNNLLDKRAQLYATPIAVFGDRNITNRPRTIGARVSYSF
jgi:iron complex outermembrane recepter protein